MAVREVPKDVLKMASGLILPSGLAGHRGQLCIVPLGAGNHHVLGKYCAYTMISLDEDE